MQLYLILFFVLLACAPCAPSELYCGPTVKGGGTHTECTTNSIENAWKGRGKKIEHWPEQNRAWETHFYGKPAIITMDRRVSPGSKRAETLKTERLILWKVGQLLGHAIEDGSTIYTVRKRMGDSKEEATDKNRLTGVSMGRLIHAAKDYYKEYGNFIFNTKDGVDIRHSFVYEKNEEGVYVRAHWIPWRYMNVPTARLPESYDMPMPLVQMWSLDVRGAIKKSLHIN